MKTFQIVLLVTFSLSCALRAQNIPEIFLQIENKTQPTDRPGCSHTLSKAAIKRMVAGGHPSAVQRRNYDVLSYDLTMDWRGPLNATQVSGISRRYQGLNTITLRVDTDTASTFEFDADQLKIDSVYVNDVKLKGGITQIGELAVIKTEQLYNYNTVVKLAVYYTQVGLSNPADFNGFMSVLEGTPWGQKLEDTVRANLCYTQSEPESARMWMPCNDRPYDKARSSITVIVPEGYSVCSNGELVKHDQQLGQDRHELYRYADTTQISTYLMMAAASKFARFDGDPYKRVTDPSKLVPAPVYLWQRDSIDYGVNLEWMQGKTQEMLASHSRYYGEYPFSKYGQTLLFPYFGGSMEHQTNTTHHRRCLTDRWESVIAHEMMHQWTGDWVTCASWSDIWLNEGGATYGEFLWLERSQGIAAARQNLRYTRDRFYFRGDMALSQPAVYGIDINNLFNTGTTYIKGGWVYAMLRTVLGDSTFFPVMRKYFTHFAQKSIETEDMVQFFESEVPNPPVPFRTFFDQWIYFRGHPLYDAHLDSLVKVDDSYDVYLTFSQSTTMFGTYGVFTMPVGLRFHDNYSPATFDTTFLNNQEKQSLRIRVPFLPHNFVIDEDQLILCERKSQEIIVSVPAAENSPEHLRVSPNPATSDEIVRIQYRCDQAAPCFVDLLDQTGRTVRNIHQGSMEAGEYQESLSASELASGWYSVRLRVGEKIYFSTFIIAH